jgi:hypothetical protein
MLESEVVQRYPIGHQEILCRGLIEETEPWINDDKSRVRRRMTPMPAALLPEQFSELESYAEKRCRPNEEARWSERLAGLMDVSCIVEPEL